MTKKIFTYILTILKTAYILRARLSYFFSLKFIVNPSSTTVYLNKFPCKSLNDHHVYFFFFEWKRNV